MDAERNITAVNVAWNWLFFRARNLFLSYIAFVPFGALAIVLFLLLLRFDRVSAWFILPYMTYLVYANFWGYKLWRLNQHTAAQNDRPVM